MRELCTLRTMAWLSIFFTSSKKSISMRWQKSHSEGKVSLVLPPFKVQIAPMQREVVWGSPHSRADFHRGLLLCDLVWAWLTIKLSFVGNVELGKTWIWCIAHHYGYYNGQKETNRISHQIRRVTVYIYRYICYLTTDTSNLKLVMADSCMHT